MLAIGVLAAGLYDNYQAKREIPPLSYTNLPMPVANSPVRQNSLAVVLVGRCVTEDLTYTITRQLQSVETGAVRLLAPASTTATKGCSIEESNLHFIPEDVPPGWYTIYGVADVNGKYKAHFVSYVTQPFEVVK